MGGTDTDNQPNTRQAIDVDAILEVTGTADAQALHVKLADGADVFLANTGIDGVSAPDAQKLVGALAAADAEIAPLFERNPAQLDAERNGREAATGVAQVDLNNWLRVEVGNPAASARLVATLNAIDGVEAALPEPVLATPSLAFAAQPVLYEAAQLYRDPAPVGIDIDYAHTIAGGRGTNVKVTDIEFSWTSSHEDIPGLADALVPNGTPEYPAAGANHGTAVVGVLAATEDAKGVSGLAPNAQLALINSTVIPASGDGLANAIDLAAASGSAGDVILIEQQLCPVPLSGAVCAPGWLPVEWWPSYHDAIVAAVGSGMTVIEPAGNGARNVDDALILPDSGAIMVGGGNPEGCTTLGDQPARGRLGFSNYGQRVDVQAHGACVWTTGAEGDPVDGGVPAEQQYTASFSGTSAAAAIVAGGSASLSSIAEQAGIPLAPSQLRALLRATGTPQDTSVDSRDIGPQPNLRAAIEDLLATAPAAPANDAQANATLVTAYPSEISQSTAGATVEIAEPVASCGAAFDTVWFRVQPEEDATVSVTATGAVTRPSMALWATPPGLPLVERACVDAGTASGTSLLEVEVTAGRTYLVQVGGVADGEVTLRFDSAELAPATPDCDFNADGYGDAGVGSPGEAIKGQANAGAVTVLYGGPKGSKVQAPQLHRNKPGVAGKARAQERFGHDVACGDLDNDGYSDLVVGVPGQARKSRGNAGAIHVFYGSSAGISTDRDRIFTQATAGVPGKSERNDWWGATVATGDPNGDGYDEIAVGAPGEKLKKRAFAGAVTVLTGTPAGTSTSGASVIHQGKRGVPNKNEPGDWLGFALTFGDTNNDGFDELYIGAPGEKFGRAANAGMVIEVPGGPGGLQRSNAKVIRPGAGVVESAATKDAGFGSALVVADLDNNGIGDLVIGAAGSQRDEPDDVAEFGGDSWVDVLPGTSQGIGQAASIVFALGERGVAGEAGSGGGFGFALAAADLDDDGAYELLVGAPGADDVGALVTITFGRSFEVLASEFIDQDSKGISSKTQRGDAFGSSVGVTDFFGDGFGAVLVGVPGEDVAKRKDAGVFVVVPGSPSGVDTTASVTMSQRTKGVGGKLNAGDQLGWS